MTLHTLRGLLVGAIAVTVAAVAVPAYAQNGSLRGKIVDETGRGVPEVEVVFDFVGPYNRQIKTITDKNGEWVRAGMPAGQGTWTITVKRGTLEGKATGITVRLNDMTRVEDIVLRAPGAQATKVAPAGMSAEEIAKQNKRQAQLEALFKESNAAFDAGNYDEAITKLTALATELETCAACHVKIGDAYLKKNDLENAEKAYLKGISLDPKMPGPYNALATIYNQQRKLDEAAKMSAKAAELLEATGGADAATLYNTGIIFWNQGKGPEAQAQFEKAIKADPKMADAYYFLGMALVNQNKMKEAKGPFEEYLKLAPDGPNAATAKLILAQIK